MPNLFEGKNVIVQGITGAHGQFQTKAMLKAGTNVVAGTTPGKGGQSIENLPVYNSIQELQEDFQVDISVIFVPAPFAKSAIIEAIDAQIPLIITVTEGIPLHDMLQVYERLQKSATSTLLGPNSPGALLPGVNKLGIIPTAFSKPGTVGIVSRSGTLTYETMAGLSEKGVGQKYVIGIGGDMIHGLGYQACLQLFQDDPDVDQIVMIGEIGGTEEIDAALFIKNHVTKPVYSYIAGHHAPTGVQLGHAGAILGSKHESAAAKTRVLKVSGAKTATSITELISLVK
ncbi:succinate--CoA ligase subunit alpha [Candidatus Saccharibacteria bacterium 49-20]|nr:MAG: succinate--CoA ligase subunit alpha [Candidatus Saccharibacteria bacterium 49-20]